MMTVLRTRFVALDSSQLGGWIADNTSPNRERRQAASNFEKELLESGWVVLLCWHHLEELLGTHDVAAAEARIRFLAAMPLIGWVRPADGSAGLGSIVDVLSAEVKAASQTGGNAIVVRDHVAKALITSGTGAQVMQPYVTCWRELQPYLWSRAERNRQIIAISKSSAIDISKVTIDSLSRGRLRDKQDIVRQFEKMARGLTDEITARADKRMVNHEEVAARFLEDVARTAPPLQGDASAFVKEVLKHFGIEQADLLANTTIGDIAELATFRRHLEIVADSSGISRTELCTRVKMDQIPSSLISQALRVYGQDLPKWEGGELTDRHLASLCPYVDLTYVDKRTKENFTRVGRKSPIVGTIVRRVEKYKSYLDVLRDIKTGDAGWRGDRRTRAA